MTTPEKEKEKLYESLFILFKCQHTVDRLWKLNTSEKSSGDVFLLAHFILEVTIFMEEFDRHFIPSTFGKYEDRVKDIKAIVKPILKKIRRWDIIGFRNNIVAHPWRDKKGGFINPDLSNYDIPQNKFEFFLLKNYLGYACGLIKEEFKEEVGEALNYFFSISDTKRSNIDYSEISFSQSNLAEEVNSICEKKKKNYHLKVMLFELPADFSKDD